MEKEKWLMTHLRQCISEMTPEDRAYVERSKASLPRRSTKPPDPDYIDKVIDGEKDMTTLKPRNMRPRNTRRMGGCIASVPEDDEVSDRLCFEQFRRDYRFMRRLMRLDIPRYCDGRLDYESLFGRDIAEIRAEEAHAKEQERLVEQWQAPTVEDILAVCFDAIEKIYIREHKHVSRSHTRAGYQQNLEKERNRMKGVFLDKLDDFCYTMKCPNKLKLVCRAKILDTWWMEAYVPLKTMLQSVGVTFDGEKFSIGDKSISVDSILSTKR